MTADDRGPAAEGYRDVRERPAALLIKARWARQGAAHGYWLLGFVFAVVAMVVGAVASNAGALALVAVCIALTAIPAYLGLAVWLNETQVAVTGGRLTVARVPLPWPKLAFRAGSVRQLFSTERRHMTQTRSGPKLYRTTYEVRVALKEGGDLTLIADLEAADQALFIEQQLERALDIADRPMPGELPRE